MNLLSIQSHVAYGHVGNSAAVFALQRLGCEVWPVHTVQLSNHLGYGQWRGSVFDAAHVGEVVRGVADAAAVAQQLVADVGLTVAVTVLAALAQRHRSPQPQPPHGANSGP